jgi:hypothetical protein
VHEVSREDEAAMERAASPKEAEPVTWLEWDLEALAERGAKRKEAVGSRFKGWGNKIKTAWNLAFAAPEMASAAKQIAVGKAREAGQSAWSAAEKQYDGAKESVGNALTEMSNRAGDAWAGAKETYGQKRQEVVDGWHRKVEATVDAGKQLLYMYEARQARIESERQALEKENAAAEFRACLQRAEQLKRQYGFNNSAENAAA